MPEIKQYFAPIKRITPSNAGYEAQERLAQSGERTAEAWTQAARRLGSLGTERAEFLKQFGELGRQRVETFKGLSHAEPAEKSGGIAMRVRGDPNGLMHSVQRADNINARNDWQARANAADDANAVASGAARLFSRGGPAERAQNEPAEKPAKQPKPEDPDNYLTEGEREALGRQKAELDKQRLRNGGLTDAEQQEHDYVQGQHQRTLRNQAEADQRRRDVDRATGTTQTQADIDNRLRELGAFNKFQNQQDPNKPDANLPINPSTKSADNPDGRPFTPNEMKQYNEATSFANKQFNNQAIPGAPELAPQSGWDATKAAVSNQPQPDLSAGEGQEPPDLTPFLPGVNTGSGTDATQDAVNTGQAPVDTTAPPATPAPAAPTPDADSDEDLKKRQLGLTTVNQ